MKSEFYQLLHLLSRAEEPPSLLPATSSMEDSDDASLSSMSTASTSSSTGCSSNSSHRSIMRRSIYIIGSFTFFCFVTSRGIVDETSKYDMSMSSWSSMPSYLRGGGYITMPLMRSSSTAKTSTTTLYEMVTPNHHRHTSRQQDQDRRRQRRRMNPLIHFGLMALQRSIDDVGTKIQVLVENAIIKQWNGLQGNIGREWSKLLSNIDKIFPPPQQHRSSILSGSSKKLDDVIHAFQLVLNKDGDNESINTAQLLKACRAHLTLMKSGGPALRLVAKDMETNLLKAETLFWSLSSSSSSSSSSNKKKENLTSLLQTEIENGVHPEANVLEESSAAMGLLWIRRSLAFQLELYASLSSSGSSGVHPTEAALHAYNKTLSPYHGWLLQKVFPLSLSQMPDRQVFLAKFGGREVHELDEEYEHIIEMKLQLLVTTWRPILDVWTKEFERLKLEDTRQA